MDIRYSEAELTKFLEMLEKKGLMKAPTARARKFAAAKVLSVLEPSEKSDLRKLDRKDVVRRFVNKYSQNFHPDSLRTYEGRFNSALEDFIAYVDNPMGFRPAGTQRASRTAKTVDQADVKLSSSRKRVPSALTSETSEPAATGLIAIPVPLPNGGMAQLYLPQRITSADAERIAAVVKALAVGQPGK